MSRINRAVLCLAILGGALAGCNVYEDSQAAKAAEAAATPTTTTSAAPSPGPEATSDAVATASSDLVIEDPFRRTDTSFSRFPLNEPGVLPEQIGRLTNGAECDDDLILCVREDANGVEHTFGGRVLAIKSIKVRPGDRRVIRALNIGTARQPPEVLARVRAFLPEVPIQCTRGPFAGEGGQTACQGSFRTGGWIKLLFSSETGQLTEARIDAFQIN